MGAKTPWLGHDDRTSETVVQMAGDKSTLALSVMRPVPGPLREGVQKGLLPLRFHLTQSPSSRARSNVQYQQLLIFTLLINNHSTLPDMKVFILFLILVVVLAEVLVPRQLRKCNIEGGVSFFPIYVPLFRSYRGPSRFS
jgi:hypothetical protein